MPAWRGIALVFMPILGVTRLRARAREAILQLVEELYKDTAARR